MRFELTTVCVLRLSVCHYTTGRALLNEFIPSKQVDLTFRAIGVEKEAKAKTSSVEVAGDARVGKKKCPSSGSESGTGFSLSPFHPALSLSRTTLAHFHASTRARSLSLALSNRFW